MTLEHRIYKIKKVTSRQETTYYASEKRAEEQNQTQRNIYAGNFVEFLLQFIGNLSNDKPPYTCELIYDGRLPLETIERKVLDGVVTIHNRDCPD